MLDISTSASILERKERRKGSGKKVQALPTTGVMKKSHRTTKEGRKGVDRGSLYDFFDSKYNDQIYHPEVKPEETPRRNIRPKTSAIVRNGKLTIDEKQLKQECAKQQTNSWFFMNSNSTVPDGFSKKVQLFDDTDYTMDQFRLSRPSRPKKEKIYDFDIAATPNPVDIKKLRPWSAPSLLLSSRKNTLFQHRQRQDYLSDSDKNEDSFF